MAEHWSRLVGATPSMYKSLVFGDEFFTNDSINKIQQNCNAEETEAESEEAFRCRPIYTPFNSAQRDMNTFNLQLQIHK